MVNYLGVENHPELASAYLIAANVINLVLDYIFLRYCLLYTSNPEYKPRIVEFSAFWA